MKSAPLKFIAVIGDVHHHIGLAAEGLERIEQETGRGIDQVFSVGDLGLFLDEEDWEFLTGPKKYRAPEESPRIRAAWKSWRWPIAAIAGNHEPFHRLRDWDASYFSFRLEYTNAGELSHSVHGLKVAGLSGIYHPREMEFVTPLERRTMKLGAVDSWPAMVALTRAKRVSISRLTYYKKFEVEHMKSLSPELLLLHDWPVPPPHIRQIYDRRPEAEIVKASQPAFVCCGHHHTSADFAIGPTRVLRPEYHFTQGTDPPAWHQRGVVIEHNLIENVPYSAISLGWGWTRQPSALADNHIRRNRIRRAMTLLRDGGAIYTLSSMPGSSIAANHITDIATEPHGLGAGAFAIYLDEGSDGITVENNLIQGIEHENHHKFNPTGRITLNGEGSFGNAEVASHAGPRRMK